MLEAYSLLRGHGKNKMRLTLCNFTPQNHLVHYSAAAAQRSQEHFRHAIEMYGKGNHREQLVQHLYFMEKYESQNDFTPCDTIAWDSL